MVEVVMREEVVNTINEKVDKTIFFAKNNSSYQHYPPSHTHTHIFYIFFFLFHYKKIACGELQGTSRALEGKGLPLVREEIHWKKRFLSGIARIPYPPPLTPIWATWSLFSDVKIQDLKVIWGLKVQNVGRGGRYINNLKKQLKVQYIGIFEEIHSFYWPKMYFLKKGQKIRAWVDPPPSFGQCPKENIFFCWCLPIAPTSRILS